MHRALTAFALLLFSPLAVQVQEHAPTADVCRADVAVWSSSDLKADYYNAETDSIKNKTPNRNELNLLPLTEIRARMSEMQKCREVDPNREDSYLKAEGFYYDVQAERWYRFLVRHQLLAQFEREDAAGKR